jgi:hypothetical protein
MPGQPRPRPARTLAGADRLARLSRSRSFDKAIAPGSWSVPFGWSPRRRDTTRVTPDPQMVEPDDREWQWAVERLHPDPERGDELWHFDEPAPPGANAGAIGIALVREGMPIRTATTTIH